VENQDGNTPPSHVLPVFEIPIVGEQHIPLALDYRIHPQEAPSKPPYRARAVAPADGIHAGNHLESPSMTCPNCGKEMTDWKLDGRLGTHVTVDVCTGCQAFWFDEHKILQLSPGSTLKLMKFIGEHSSTVKPTLPDVLRCPRCGGSLSLAHDLVRNMRFNYWGCESGHGRLGTLDD
jgi:ribosomal protein S27AE